MATLKRYTKTTPTGELVTTSVVVQNNVGTFELQTDKIMPAGFDSAAVDKAVYKNTDSSMSFQYVVALRTTQNKYPTEGGSVRAYANLTFNDAGEVTAKLGGSDEAITSLVQSYTGIAETLFTVASGKADAIVSVVLNGGTNGGTVNLHENNGTADFSTQAVTLTANQNIVLEYKQFLQAGDSYKVSSTSTGITVTVNVYEKDQA